MALDNQFGEREWSQPEAPTAPFGEVNTAAAVASSPTQFAGWSQSLAPFAIDEDGPGEAEQEQLLDEVLLELRDEGFDEAVANLVDETEQAVAERFTSEEPLYAPHRERFAASYLSPVQFEGEQYITVLSEGLSTVDVRMLEPQQLDELLDQFDPALGELTPAGEEFIGKLVKKAKSVVKAVAAKAKKLAKVAMPFLKPLLDKLKKMVGPLIERVLSFAIGRLPQPLRPAAQKLADRLLKKVAPNADTGAAADAPAGDGTVPDMAPAAQFDVEMLAESFDYSLAEAIAFPNNFAFEGEDFDSLSAEPLVESRELETLAEARSRLIEQLRAAGEHEDMAPVIEQFVPAVLAALRTGIRLIGRPKVVNFLGGYLAKLIQRWIGPDQARPLANAIVDTGLRLITLEAEASVAANEAAPVALASVIEDAVRRFAENEDYIFEDEDLAHVAAADAFGEAVASHFPQEHIRSELQLAPSLGGTFVTRQPRSPRSYAKYNRTPEIEISARAANAIPAFGGTTLGSTLKARGGTFPMRARMHIFQAKPGSSIGSMLRHDQRGGRGGAGAFPLTPQAAGILLREPGLGVAVPSRFLRSRRRIAAGQRIYVLEPLGTTLANDANLGIGARRIAPGRAWIAINPGKARITVGFYLSEVEAQTIAEAIRKGDGHGALLRQLLGGLKQASPSGSAGASATAHEDGEDFEDFAARAGRFLPHGFKQVLRRRIAAWAMPALSSWLRGNAEAFLRAAAHPDPGVRIRVRLDGVAALAASGSGLRSLAAFAAALRGKPAVTILVTPGGSNR